MPKRKRINEGKKEEARKLQKKIRKYQERLNFLSSDSSTDSTSSEQSESSSGDMHETANMEETIASNALVEQEIDFDFFGAKQTDKAQIGTPMHEEIAVRWSTVLQNGLTTTQRNEIMEKFKVPENCLALIPPKTNEEIQQCLPELAAKHDKFIAAVQSQLGHGLSAIATVIGQNLPVTDQANNTKILGEASQIIANVHNALSVHRKAGLEEIKHRLKEDKQASWKSSCQHFRNTKEIPPAFKLPADAVQGQIQGKEGGGETEEGEEQEQTPTLQSAGVLRVLSPNLSPGGPDNEVNKYAGRLSEFSHAWKTITSDKKVLSWVKGITLPFSKRPKQYVKPKINIKKCQNKDYSCAIKKLIEIRAVSKCRPVKNQFLSPYFLRKKPNGENRFILNLKNLNTFLNVPHIKLEDHRTVLRLVNQNNYLAKIDLKDAYFLVPVRKTYRKFLRGPYLNLTHYLRFKYSTLYFHKITQTMFYLDDILFIANNKSECERNVKFAIQLLENLGFIINSTKSVLQPTQIITFLGFSYNTLNMTISLPEGKILDIKQKNPGLQEKKISALLGNSRN
ncbi:hypothetical protein NQ315_002689 [Exocentrus adspersus]|uniref:Reverse transcriptase domain-containing protein n=1 Tax=Exocentrus adspersus TaxID=1586481 RepID=A0AAV8VHV8_9CUCU|nr:hypothetical protein NQ315_002689 [Exocentrus adspersus]